MSGFVCTVLQNTFPNDSGSEEIANKQYTKMNNALPETDSDYFHILFVLIVMHVPIHSLNSNSRTLSIVCTHQRTTMPIAPPTRTVLSLFNPQTLMICHNEPNAYTHHHYSANCTRLAVGGSGSNTEHAFSSACGVSVMSHVARQTSCEGPRVVSPIQITIGLYHASVDVVVVVSSSIVDESRKFVRVVWRGLCASVNESKNSNKTACSARGHITITETATAASLLISTDFCSHFLFAA